MHRPFKMGPPHAVVNPRCAWVLFTQRRLSNLESFYLRHVAQSAFVSETRSASRGECSRCLKRVPHGPPSRQTWPNPGDFGRESTGVFGRCWPGFDQFSVISADLGLHLHLQRPHVPGTLIDQRSLCHGHGVARTCVGDRLVVCDGFHVLGALRGALSRPKTGTHGS